MLIKGYGENWNPDIIDWSKNQLIGYYDQVKPKINIDFFNATGLYVLESEFNPIYIGRGEKIGLRLKAHLSDRFAGHWDMFSFYSISYIDLNREKINSPNTNRIAPDTINKTLEALSILLVNPKLNRRREKIPGAKQFYQLEQKNQKTIRKYLQEILDKIP